MLGEGGREGEKERGRRGERRERGRGMREGCCLEDSYSTGISHLWSLGSVIFMWSRSSVCCSISTTTLLISGP